MFVFEEGLLFGKSVEKEARKAAGLEDIVR